VIDTGGIEARTAAHDAVHRIPLREQQLA
jgi:hypothetical protein